MGTEEKRQKSEHREQKPRVSQETAAAQWPSSPEALLLSSDISELEAYSQFGCRFSPPLAGWVLLSTVHEVSKKILAFVWSDVLDPQNSLGLFFCSRMNDNIAHSLITYAKVTQDAFQFPHTFLVPFLQDDIAIPGK